MKDEELLKAIEARLKDVSDMLEKLDFTRLEYKEKAISMIEECLDLANNLDTID